jgi:hypothetical protein
MGFTDISMMIKVRVERSLDNHVTLEHSRSCHNIITHTSTSVDLARYMGYDTDRRPSTVAEVGPIRPQCHGIFRWDDLVTEPQH